MAHQVTIGAGHDNVELPNGFFYTAGDVVVLTDDQFAQINPDMITNGTVVDNGEVDTADAVSAQAANVPALGALTAGAPAALTSAQVATADGSDPTTTQALANALKAAYNQLQADVAALRTNQGAVVTDLGSIRTKLNAALAALTGLGKPMHT